MVVVPVPLTASAEEMTAAILGHVTDRTRLAVIDHISSPTARLFPVERLIPELRERGVAVFIDAAHVPDAAGRPGVPRPGLLDGQPPQVGLRAEGRRTALRRSEVAARDAAARRVLARARGYPNNFLQYGTADLTAASRHRPRGI